MVFIESVLDFWSQFAIEFVKVSKDIFVSCFYIGVYLNINCDYTNYNKICEPIDLDDSIFTNYLKFE